MNMLFKAERAIALVFSVAVVVRLALYLNVHERVPNYLRILEWLVAWWR